MDSKKFYESKTFWTNVVGLIVILLGPMVGIKEETLPPETMVSVLAFLNILLRFVTKKEISIR